MTVIYIMIMVNNKVMIVYSENFVKLPVSKS
jgi:hypothetical protein